jgi:hypothetical protein
MLATVNLFAGLAFNPGIRGILVVAVGVAVLMGSVYILLATNTGSRLGMLLALTGLFGWLTVLTLFWWISPPAIGPRGNNASWTPVEIIVNDGTVAKTEVVGSLINPNDLPTSDEILAAHPELAQEYPNGFQLSDLKANNPEILQDVLPSDSLNGWRLTPSSSAGESQAAADTALINAKVFTANTEYKKLNVWEFGGKPTRLQYCPDAKGGSFLADDPVCRIQYKLSKLFTFSHPKHYAVVQVQPVIPQETKPGEAPPTPVVDQSKPVISVVLVRDLGDVRLIPFLYFVISLSLFVIFAWTLHNRDKILMKNKALAEAAAKGD